MTVHNHDYEKVWLKWQVQYCKERSCLTSSNFKIEELNQLPKVKEIQIPFIWVNNLEKKYNWLHILRNSQHIPQDPFELVKFIQDLDQINH